VMILLSTGIVAGYAGTRLLKKMTDKFLNEFEKIRKDMGEEKENSENLSSGIGLATLALSKTAKGPQEADFVALANSAIPKLEKALVHSSSSTPVAIFLARLYRWLQKLPDAIRVLEFAVDKRKAEGKTQDREDAIIFFNLACYYNMQSREGIDPLRADLKKKARAAFAASVSVCPEFEADIKTDADLKDLHDE